MKDEMEPAATQRPEMSLSAVHWALKEFCDELRPTVGQKRKERLDKIVKQAYEMEDRQKIEFAKIHVKAALKAASEGRIEKVIHMMTKYGESMDWKETILTSYPLENIK